MRKFYLAVRSWINKRTIGILFLLIVAYFLIFTAACWFKYQTFNYDGLDLAILNQVFFNTSHGDLFAASIHPPSYLGDHFTPIILLLTPFYLIYRSPLTLLLLQTLILALSAWPVYLLAKNKLGKLWGVFFAILFLFNPIVHNINLYEFHLLPWAVFFLFWACYFFTKKKFWPWLLFLFLALLVREDVALIVIMFSFLALIMRCKWIWRLLPVFLGLGWLLIAFYTTKHFNPAEGYKFLVYYQWLGGDSLLSVMKSFFSHPLKVISHLLTVGNLEMLLGFFMAWLFLPLLALRYLWLAAIVFLQYLLGAPGGSSLIFQTHYAALFLPALVLSAIYGLDRLKQKQQRYLQLPCKQRNFRQLVITDNKILAIIIVAALIYNLLALGSVLGLFQELANYSAKEAQIDLKQEFVRLIPDQAGVAATYEFLPQLSSRQHLASLHYIYLGRQQFSKERYPLPAEIDYLLIDFNDFLYYPAQFADSQFFNADYPQAAGNFRQVLKDFSLIKTKDALALFQRGEVEPEQLLYQVITVDNYQPTTDIELLNQQLKLTSLNNEIVRQDQQYYLDLQLDLQALQSLGEDYDLEMKVFNQSGQELYQDYFPLVYGLYPSREWQPNEVICSHYSWLLPNLTTGDYLIKVYLVKIKAELQLNNLRRGEFQILKRQEIAEIFNQDWQLD